MEKKHFGFSGKQKRGHQYSRVFLLVTTLWSPGALVPKARASTQGTALAACECPGGAPRHPGLTLPKSRYIRPPSSLPHGWGLQTESSLAQGWDQPENWGKAPRSPEGSSLAGLLAFCLWLALILGLTQLLRGALGLRARKCGLQCVHNGTHHHLQGQRGGSVSALSPQKESNPPQNNHLTVLCAIGQAWCQATKLSLLHQQSQHHSMTTILLPLWP